jgi:hypothetical protein
VVTTKPAIIMIQTSEAARRAAPARLGRQQHQEGCAGGGDAPADQEERQHRDGEAGEETGRLDHGHRNRRAGAAQCQHRRAADDPRRPPPPISEPWPMRGREICTA